MDATIPVLNARVGDARQPVGFRLMASSPMQSFTLRSELAKDGPHLETILDAAFGPGRFAKVSERVRELARHDLALSQVAHAGATLIGCCRLYRIAIGTAPALFLGPLAVDPRVQAGGVGRALVAAALAQADDERPIVVVGQPRFFAPFGFVQIPDGRVVMPGPTEARRLQWLNAADTVRGAISGPRAAS